MRTIALLALLAGCGGGTWIEATAEEPPCDAMAPPAVEGGALDVCCEKDAPICAEWQGPEWASRECIVHALCAGHCEGWYDHGAPCDGGTCDDKGRCVQ